MKPQEKIYRQILRLLTSYRITALKCYIPISVERQIIKVVKQGNSFVLVTDSRIFDVTKTVDESDRIIYKKSEITELPTYQLNKVLKDIQSWIAFIEK